MITSLEDAGRTKLDAPAGIGLQCLRKVESGEVDLLIPISNGIKVAAGIQRAAADRVVGYFFAVSVTENQNS